MRALKTKTMILLLIFLTCATFAICDNSCTLFLAPSKLRNAGLGIFAGSNFSKDNVVEEAVSLLFGTDLLNRNPLENYVYVSHDERYSVCVFGAGMMFNHIENPNVDAHSEEVFSDANSVNIRPYSFHNHKVYKAEHDIVMGTELYISYGDESWFLDRDIAYEPSTLKPSQGYSMTELKKIGHCMSDVYVSESTIPMAGRGAFANRDFASGELVSVSPTLLIPKHIVEAEGTSSLLLNYVITHPQSDVVVLSTGKASLCNHDSPDRSNVEVRWVRNLQGDSFADNINVFPDIHHIFRSKSASMYLGYFATRPISVDEELTFSYGPKWEIEWAKYLELLEQWLDLHHNSTQRFNTSDIISKAPQFRHPIGAPEGLFPSHMMTEGGHYSTIDKKKALIISETHLRPMDIDILRRSRELINRLNRPISFISKLRECFATLIY